MSVPQKFAGEFAKTCLLEQKSKLTRKRGLDRTEYESLLLGRWAWSSDGTSHDHFILFNEDNTCSFQNLLMRTVKAYEG